MARKIRAKLIMELHEQGLSRRKIAATRRMSMESACDVFDIAAERGIGWDDVKDMSGDDVPANMVRVYHPTCKQLYIIFVELHRSFNQECVAMAEDKRNARIEDGEEPSARAMNAVSSGSYDGRQPEFKLPNDKKCPTGGWVSCPDGVQRESALQREETLHMPEVQHNGVFLLLPARCAC